MDTRNDPRRILAVLAHPDDEAFGMGGTLALYAHRGDQVTLVCATFGEAGSVADEFLYNGQTIAQLRAEELECSSKALGLQQVIHLGYRDSGMEGSVDNHHPQALISQPLEVVSEKIADVIRDIKPDAVLTFDPIGGYRHPDHIFIHKATIQAFHLVRMESGSTPSRLFFHIMPKGFIRTSIFFLRLTGKDPRKFGKNQDIDLMAIVDQDFPIHVRINYSEVVKEQANAASCHASQGGNIKPKGLKKLLNIIFNRHQDTFMQAFPPPEDAKGIKRDLFDV